VTVAVQRNDPYGAFNFVVSIGGAQGDGGVGAIVGGFAEVSGLAVTVDYAEYRNGNEKLSTPRKIPGQTRVHDVTLKRGVIGSIDLFDWLRTVSQGSPDPRDMTITLLDGERQPVVTWRLRRAQPAAWSGPHLVASGNTIAMEELRIVYEGLQME
jgi:phage tail-like protein